MTEALLRACQGQWDMVIPRVVPEIQPALNNLARFKTSDHVVCIFCGQKKFRCLKGFADTAKCICVCTEGNPITSGIDIVMRARGWDFLTARDEIMRVAGMVPNDIANPASYTPPRRLTPVKSEETIRQEQEELKREAEYTKRRICTLWNETVPLDHLDAEPAYHWFRNRGVLPIRLPITDIRFHPSMPFNYQGKTLGYYPCILAMLRDGDLRSKTLHRTFITKDGRKPPEALQLGISNRKLYAVPNDLTCTGSAIRFDEPENILGLAEGLETALSGRLLAGFPTWSTYSRNLMKSIVIPDSVKIIVVWADKDRSGDGQKSAAELVLRLRAEGRRAFAFLPPGDIEEGAKSLDWNDLVMRMSIEEIHALPEYQQFSQALENILNPPAPKIDFRDVAFTR